MPLKIKLKRRKIKLNPKKVIKKKGEFRKRPNRVA